MIVPLKARVAKCLWPVGDGGGKEIPRLKKVAFALVCWLLAGCGAAANDAKPQLILPQSLRFIVLGDTRPIEPCGSLPQIFKDIVSEVNLLHPDAVVHVGDQIYGCRPGSGGTGAYARLLEQWAEFDALWDTVDCAKKYRAVGNHDVFDEESEEIYLTRYGPGPLYYSADVWGCHFVLLNTEEGYPEWNEEATLSEEQINWLRDDLQKSRSKRIFVFLHRPLWGSTENPEHWQEDILPLLNQYRVDAVFAGHWHCFSYDVKDDMLHVVTGGAGEDVGADEKKGEFHHVTLVTVPLDPKKAPEITVVRTGGILHPDGQGKGKEWKVLEGHWVKADSGKHKVTSTLERP